MNKNCDKSNLNYIIFVYDNFCIGGIQTYIYNAVSFLKKKNFEILIYRDRKYSIDKIFEDILNEKNVKIMFLDNFNFMEMYNIVGDSFHSIRIFTFRLQDFAIAEDIKIKFQKNCHTFYLVPNFKGAYYYLEETFSGRKRQKIHDRMEQIIQMMNNNGNIMYFNSRHVEAMSKTYNYNISDINKYLVPGIPNIQIFDESQRIKIYNRKEFKILAVSRFEFPHKGFFIGLIQAFDQLCRKYDNIFLDIVGYGEGYQRIYDEINSISSIAKNHIIMHDKCSQKKLIEYYRDANLNISAAGCCCFGAHYGTLSIPVRHYDYTCEVYGFLPDAIDFVVSDKKGENVIAYIEQVLSMSQDEYISRCKKGLEYFNNLNKKEEFSLGYKINITNKTIGKDNIQYILSLVKWIKFNLIRNSYAERIKNLGLKEFICNAIKKRLKSLINIT